MSCIFFRLRGPNCENRSVQFPTCPSIIGALKKSGAWVLIQALGFSWRAWTQVLTTI